MSARGGLAVHLRSVKVRFLLNLGTVNSECVIVLNTLSSETRTSSSENVSSTNICPNNVKKVYGYCTGSIFRRRLRFDQGKFRWQGPLRRHLLIYFLYLTKFFPNAWRQLRMTFGDLLLSHAQVFVDPTPPDFRTSSSSSRSRSRLVSPSIIVPPYRNF
ncbi:hypothetical protein Y032_0013g1923 [Ancylostoma ceylanicum]|uniref:Uncharacterized protein n=1 Tax=Ancylostoma ceylanicum TaxID=53326 RepID=A0A016VB40_9BILA|nr:hypothetical protein Y032_0013g1923 [Ancylostoma ceylanicum]